MTDQTAGGSERPVTNPADRKLKWEHDLRLWSGIVLLVYVTTHLMNHALGIFGVDAMEAVQTWRVWAWRSWPGTVLLYGAGITHILLALKRIVSRRTWRMPVQDAAQIALGLSIPLLLYEHLIGTRIMSSFEHTNDRYLYELVMLWPANAWRQTMLVLVVWGHGMIGLHYAVRHRDWYPRVRMAGIVAAFMLPTLALAGFVSGAREALEFDTTKGAWTTAQRAFFDMVARDVNLGILGAAAALVTIIVALEVMRRIGGKVTLRYVGHGDIAMPKGLTLLEASRDNGIPHPSLCGGRARCSTCRVLILKGLESLPEAGPAERAILSRISAPPRVRLACQIRPAKDLSLQILLPVEVPEGQVDWDEEAFKWGVERTATVLFVDLRAFDKLTHSQLPYDLVVLLNRFVAEMRQAIEAHGGRVTLFLSDGLMAVFGLSSDHRRSGSRSAMAAARDMLKVADALNAEFSAALPLPLRVGIGVHTGPIVMARIGDEERGFMVTALGETVTIASYLEEATKDLLTDCLISQTTFDASRQGVPSVEPREIHVPGLNEPIVAYPLVTAPVKERVKAE